MLEPKQSKLDYLWENFGERGVVTSPDSVSEDSIPSYGLIQELLNSLCSKAVGSVTKEQNSLIIKSVEGREINRIKLENIPDVVIDAFGRRKVTQKDIDNSCPYPLDSYIYYIRLNNGIEYTAPTHVYEAGITKTIRNTILDDTIYSDLKISEKVKGVIFTKEEDGIAGRVYLEGATQGIQFAVLTKDEYDSIIKDTYTLYFIKDKPYFYFGQKRLGSDSLEDLEEIYSRLTNIENLYKWEENG